MYSFLNVVMFHWKRRRSSEWGVEQHRTDINHSVGQVEREEVKQGGSWEVCVGGQQPVWCSHHAVRCGMCEVSVC